MVLLGGPNIPAGPVHGPLRTHSPHKDHFARSIGGRQQLHAAWFLRKIDTIFNQDIIALVEFHSYSQYNTMQKAEKRLLGMNNQNNQQ
jgi:indole-3-glycerol phosphate synthase